MSDSSETFTPTDLIAAASQVLTSGHYQRIAQNLPDWETPTSRLFENEYNIVGVVVFETCRELLNAWADLQGSLVDTISKYVGHEESKAWDGYLVLLSPNYAPSEREAIEAIRYDTGRVRKLVATGEDLKTSTEVERVLRPLLPLAQERVGLTQESPLELLPRLLAEHGIPEVVTKTLIDGFRKQSPLLEKLHEIRREK